MKRALMIAVGIVGIGGAGVLVHDTDAHGRCVRLKGKGGIRSSQVTTGCTSPVGLCTAGVYQGEWFLEGTTSFVADALAPSAGLPGAVEAPTTLSYSGLLTITTPDGTLTTRDTGIFDTANGLFAARDLVVGGTGDFAGATGYIFWTGTGVTEFDARSTGELCFK